MVNYMKSLFESFEQTFLFVGNGKLMLSSDVLILPDNFRANNGMYKKSTAEYLENSAETFIFAL